MEKITRQEKRMMKKQNSLKNIAKVIEGLSTEKQLRLVEKITHHLRVSELGKKELDWNELYGLGKGLWKEDAQTYINLLREDLV
jgi:hypothetical protein